MAVRRKRPRRSKAEASTRAVIAQRLRGQHSALEEAHGPRHPDTLRGLLALGRALTNLGEHDEAHQHLRYVAQHSPRVFGAEHPDTAVAFHALARCYAQRGQRRFAIRYYRRALAIREVAFDEFDERTGATIDALIELVRFNEDRQETMHLYRRSLAFIEHECGLESEAVNARLWDLVTVIGPSRGEVLLRAEVARRERLLPAGHPETIFCMRLLARVLEFRLRKARWKMGKVPSADWFDQAKAVEALLHRIVELEAAAPEPDDGAIDHSLRVLRRVLEASGREREWLAVCRHWSELYARLPGHGPVSDAVARWLRKLADHLESDDQWTEVVSARARVLEIEEALYGELGTRAREDRLALAAALRAAGRPGEALPVLERALEIARKRRDKVSVLKAEIAELTAQIAE